MMNAILIACGVCAVAYCLALLGKFCLWLSPPRWLSISGGVALLGLALSPFGRAFGWLLLVASPVLCILITGIAAARFAYSVFLLKQRGDMAWFASSLALFIALFVFCALARGFVGVR